MDSLKSEPKLDPKVPHPDSELNVTEKEKSVASKLSRPVSNVDTQGTLNRSNSVQSNRSSTSSGYSSDATPLAGKPNEAIAMSGIDEKMDEDTAQSVHFSLCEKELPADFKFKPEHSGPDDDIGLVNESRTEEATAGETFPKERLSCSSLSSPENSARSRTSSSQPSYCLCQCRVSPRSSVHSGCHADVVATQECDQGDIGFAAAASSVFRRDEVERWLNETCDKLNIDPYFDALPNESDQSLANIDVYRTSREQATSDDLPSHTLDLILDCSNCRSGSEEQIYMHMVNDPDDFQDLRECLSDIGDLNSVNYGCIILTFNIRNRQERDNLERAFNEGILRNKIANWLRNRNEKSGFRMNLSIPSLPQDKIENNLCQDSLDKPVEFAFCHCAKKWYWSYDRDQWYHVGIREISRDGKMCRPMEADLRLMQRLLKCDQSPTDKEGNECVMCTARKTDARKVMEHDIDKGENTTSSIRVDPQEIWTDEGSLNAISSVDFGAASSGYSSGSDEGSCQFENAKEVTVLNVAEAIDKGKIITQANVFLTA